MMKQLFFIRTKHTNEWVKPAGTDVFKPVYDLSLNPEGAALFDDQNSKTLLKHMQETHPTVEFERLDAMKFMEEQKSKGKSKNN